MSGLMNSYFYGKAGQGDYTVEQMPTTRKQLFFTTLRVRLSSMIGLNLLHVLFTLPLIVWLSISWSMVSAILSEDAYKLGGQDMENSYMVYSEYRSEYEAIVKSDSRLAELQVNLNVANVDIQKLNDGGEVLIEEPGIAGAEPTMRPATLAELTAKRDGIQAEITQSLRLNEYRVALEAIKGLSVEDYLEDVDSGLIALLPSPASGLTPLERAQALYDAIDADSENHKDTRDELHVLILLTKALAAESEYEAMRTSLLTSQISLALMIMIPLIGIAGIGSTGQMYVLRNWARDEHSFVWSDYKAAIKLNWKQGLVVGLLNGFSLFLCYIGFMTYRSMAASGSVFFVVPQMFMLVLLIVWWMMNEIMFPMMVTYDMKLRHLLRNSVIMVLARLPMSFLILLGSLIIPFGLLLFVPLSYSILILLLLYGLLGFSLTGFVYASYANSCFDRYLNPRIEGAEVNKGLRNPEDDDDDEPVKPVEEVEAKPERFWEHKK